MTTVMTSFLDHLKERFEEQSFDDDGEDEWNEIVRGLYAELVACVRDGADTLIISSTAVTQLRAGTEMRQRDIRRHEYGGSLPPERRGSWMSFRTAMEVIRRHDDQVRQHVRLVEETPEAVTYRIH